MPPISPEALCLTKAKCLQALPLNQCTSSPFPMWFRLLGVIIEPHGPDSELREFINLVIWLLISLPITIISLCSLTGTTPMENSDINGNVLSLCNTDLNLAQHMGKTKKNQTTTYGSLLVVTIKKQIRHPLSKSALHQNIPQYADVKAKGNTSQLPNIVEDLAILPSVITCSSRHY